MRAKTAALIVALVIEIILLVVVGVVALIVNTLFGFGLGSVLFLGPVSLAFWLILLIIAVLLVILIIGTIIAIIASATRDYRRRRQEKRYGTEIPVRVEESKPIYWSQDVDQSIDRARETAIDVEAVNTKADAVRILDERYARGEITRDDYMRMREDIKGKESGQA